MPWIGIGEAESSKEVELSVVYELGSFPVIVQTYAEHQCRSSPHKQKAKENVPIEPSTSSAVGLCLVSVHS